MGLRLKAEKLRICLYIINYIHLRHVSFRRVRAMMSSRILIPRRRWLLQRNKSRLELATILSRS